MSPKKRILTPKTGDAEARNATEKRYSVNIQSSQVAN